MLAGKDTDLFHDGFEESLGDLARRKAGQFGIDLRERTHAGLSAALAPGRKGGRPKGVPINAESTAYAAETLDPEGELSSQAIANFGSTFHPRANT